MLSASSMNKRVYSRAGVQMKLFPNSRTGNINSIATIDKIDQQKNMFEATRYFFRKLTKLSVNTETVDRENGNTYGEELDNFFKMKADARDTLMKQFRASYETNNDFPTDSAALKEHIRVADLSNTKLGPDMKAFIKTVKESKIQTLEPMVTEEPDFEIVNFMRTGVNAHKYKEHNHEVELSYTMLK